MSETRLPLIVEPDHLERVLGDRDRNLRLSVRPGTL